MNTDTNRFAVTLALTPALVAAATAYATNRDNQSDVPWDKEKDAKAVFTILSEDYGLTGLHSFGSSYFGKDEDGLTVWLEIKNAEKIQLVWCTDVKAGLSLLKVIWREESTPESNRKLLDSIEGDWIYEDAPVWTFEQFQRVLRECGRDENYITEMWGCRPPHFNDRFDERYLRLTVGVSEEEQAPAPEVDAIGKLLGGGGQLPEGVHVIGPDGEGIPEELKGLLPAPLLDILTGGSGDVESEPEPTPKPTPAGLHAPVHGGYPNQG